MDYIFGTNSAGEETLTTKGPEHSAFAGFCQTVRKYDDCTITDSFFVKYKYKSSEDTEGNCYDWYIIDKHNRNIDFMPKVESILQNYKSQLAQTDDALIELYEMIGG